MPTDGPLYTLRAGHQPYSPSSLYHVRAPDQLWLARSEL